MYIYKKKADSFSLSICLILSLFNYVRVQISPQREFVRFTSTKRTFENAPYRQQKASVTPRFFEGYIFFVSALWLRVAGSTAGKVMRTVDALYGE